VDQTPVHGNSEQMKTRRERCEALKLAMGN